jgi:hypothetical protein
VSPATSPQQRTNSRQNVSSSPEIAGFLIDENGREVAITEQMIQQACADLERHWRPARRQASSAG